MRKSLPADLQASMSEDDFTVIFAIGDWLVQLNGSGVPAETLLVVAPTVNVR